MIYYSFYNCSNLTIICTIFIILSPCSRPIYANESLMQKALLIHVFKVFKVRVPVWLYHQREQKMTQVLKPTDTHTKDTHTHQLLQQVWRAASHVSAAPATLRWFRLRFLNNLQQLKCLEDLRMVYFGTNEATSTRKRTHWSGQDDTGHSTCLHTGTNRSSCGRHTHRQEIMMRNWQLKLQDSSPRLLCSTAMW